MIVKMNFKKIFNIFLLTIFLSSCATKNWYKPRGYLLFSMKPKGGSPGYSLGWDHGCESGAGTQFGGSFFVSFYKWKKDPDIASTRPDIEKIRRKYGNKELKDINWNDPKDIKRNFADYNLVFWDAHFLCRQVTLGTLQMAGMDPSLPGGVRYDPTAHHIGSIYSITSKGDNRIGSSSSTGGYW